MMRQLSELEDAFPALRTPDSPTQQIGPPPSTTFTPVEHLQRLMSLDSAFTREELDRWAQRAIRELGEAARAVGYLCELKVDGLAIDLVYENGGLVTRRSREARPSGRGVLRMSRRSPSSRSTLGPRYAPKHAGKYAAGSSSWSPLHRSSMSLWSWTVRLRLPIPGMQRLVRCAAEGSQDHRLTKSRLRLPRAWACLTASRLIGCPALTPPWIAGDFR